MDRALGFPEDKAFFEIFFKHFFGGHADGERRGLDRIRGWHQEGLGETRLSAPSDRQVSLTFAVGTF